MNKLLLIMPAIAALLISLAGFTPAQAHPGWGWGHNCGYRGAGYGWGHHRWCNPVGYGYGGPRYARFGNYGYGGYGYGQPGYGYGQPGWGYPVGRIGTLVRPWY